MSLKKLDLCDKEIVRQRKKINYAIYVASGDKSDNSVTNGIVWKKL